MANGNKSFSIKKDALARTRVYLVFALVLVGLYFFIKFYWNFNSDTIDTNWLLAYLITGVAMTPIPLSTYSKKFKRLYSEGGIMKSEHLTNCDNVNRIDNVGKEEVQIDLKHKKTTNQNERAITAEKTANETAHLNQEEVIINIETKRINDKYENGLTEDEAITTIADERKEGTIMDFEIKREIKLHKESVIQKAIESGIIHKDSYDNLRVYFETGNAPNKIKFLKVKFDDLKPLSKNSSFLTFFCVLFENDIIQQYEDIRLDDNKKHSTVELRREILDEMNMNFDIGENIEDLLGKHFISRKKKTVEKQKSMIKKMIGLKS